MYNPKTGNTGVVFTDNAQCRDCYRCVRACPVKAIRMEDSQAAVDAELCIGCGTCIRQCPQNAKKYRHDLNLAKHILSTQAKVAVSIAPSFAAVYQPWQHKRMPSLLRRLGFSHVSETAVAAWHVARETAEYIKNNPGRVHISTACPAVVSFVEKYHPECMEMLTPVVSPMIAHGKMLREKFGNDLKVIFIGPCVAKKQEADREEYTGLIDCVLTFEELAKWIEQENMDFRQLEESAFDEIPNGDARYFPLPGGAILSAGITPEMLSGEILAVSGFDETREMLADAAKIDHTLLIEPLMCTQGCVNGPAINTDSNLFHRRAELLKYTTENPGKNKAVNGYNPALPNCRFHQTSNVLAANEFTDQQITEVLAQTGKADKANQLDCGACGYDTCRDKAIAVLRDLAEPEMCIPYMRRLAEGRTDLIIETSPNGIVMLDKRLNIISMNKAFKDMFRCSDSICGKPVSYLLDPAAFERIAINENSEVIEQVTRHDAYSVICHEVIYALPQQHQYVGIFVNITRQRDNQQQLDKLKRQTVQRAQQLHDQQIAMAQQIAEFLGSSTARSEKLLSDLAELTQNGQHRAKGDDKWLSRTYMSK